MTLDYFYGQSGELFAYFRIPKALFQDSRFRQLSTDARTLYGILLDRMSLSVKNNWLDEQGRVYIMEVALVNSMNREKMLKQVLDSAKREYDYILLDCTPSLGMLTVNALAAADTTLIPMQAQYLSAKGLEQLLQTIGKVRRQINPKLKIEGILLTMTDNRTIYGQQISNLIRQGYGKHLKVFNQTIPRSIRAAEISTTGKSIYQHDPKGKVAEAYHSIAKEVVADAEKRLKRNAERDKEALNHAFDEPKQWEIREINEIMNQCIDRWRYFPNPRMFSEYGRQKGWERENPATDSGNPSEKTMDGFVEVTEQMELPF